MNTWIRCREEGVVVKGILSSLKRRRIRMLTLTWKIPQELPPRKIRYLWSLEYSLFMRTRTGSESMLLKSSKILRL